MHFAAVRLRLACYVSSVISTAKHNAYGTHDEDPRAIRLADKTIYVTLHVAVNQ